MNEIIKSLNAMHGKDNWSNTFQPWGERIICHITIKGVTRSAVADTDEKSFVKAWGYFTTTETRRNMNAEAINSVDELYRELLEWRSGDRWLDSDGEGNYTPDKNEDR